jgi:beta-glucosidase/6-phospho-beta-glucosidase/beta-galactosidase
MFRRFNGTIRLWYTFNEPGVFCVQVSRRDADADDSQVSLRM